MNLEKDHEIVLHLKNLITAAEVTIANIQQGLSINESVSAITTNVGSALVKCGEYQERYYQKHVR